MSKSLLIAAFCMLLMPCNAEATSVLNGDLFSKYPEAKDELTALVSCRAIYIRQHYQDQASAEVIANGSYYACKDEQTQFNRKIGKTDNDSDFSMYLNSIIVAKIEKLRTEGLPSGPAVDWAKCLNAHIVLPTTKAGIPNSLDKAFAACQMQEDALANFFMKKMTPSEVKNDISIAKNGFRNRFQQLLEARLK